MTKHEFIDRYIAGESGLTRTADGYSVPNSDLPETIAYPCDCGDEICEGWQMTTREDQNYQAKLHRRPIPFPDAGFPKWYKHIA